MQVSGTVEPSYSTTPPRWATPYLIVIVKYISLLLKKYTSYFYDNRKTSYCIVIVARAINIGGNLMDTPFA